MAKKIVRKKSKTRKPKVGDNVFIKGETQYRRWLFLEKLFVDGKEFARCSTTIPKLDGPAEHLEEVVSLDRLTLEPPLLPPLPPSAYIVG